MSIFDLQSQCERKSRKVRSAYRSSLFTSRHVVKNRWWQARRRRPIGVWCGRWWCRHTASQSHPGRPRCSRALLLPANLQTSLQIVIPRSEATHKSVLEPSTVRFLLVYPQYLVLYIWVMHDSSYANGLVWTIYLENLTWPAASRSGSLVNIDSPAELLVYLRGS